MLHRTTRYDAGVRGKAKPMITIEHTKDWSYVGYPNRRIDTHRGIARFETYHLGISAPNYPLPAIPLRTVIADSYVFVEHINDYRLCFYSNNSGFPDLWASEVVEINFGASR